MKKIPVKDRFWTKVDIIEPNKCWLWKAGKDEEGYGRISVNGKARSAHRTSYELTYGLIELGKLVLHTCDNPSCVNPKHLYLGTDADNTRDKVNKKRHKWMSGEKNGKSKLTKKLVLELRQKHFSFKISTCELARQYNFSQSAIYKAIYKKTWKDVD